MSRVIWSTEERIAMVAVVVGGNEASGVFGVLDFRGLRARTEATGFWAATWATLSGKR